MSEFVFFCTYSRPRYQVSVYRTISPLVSYVKIKAQINCTVTTQQMSTFVSLQGYAKIVQSLCFSKFETSSHLLWPYSPICVGPGQKPRRQVFLQRGSNNNVCYPGD